MPSAMRRYSLFFAIILLLTLTQCIPTHAFLKSLFFSSDEPQQQQVKQAPTSASSDYFDSTYSSVTLPRSSTSGSSASSFLLPSLGALHANLKDMVERGHIVPRRCRAVSLDDSIFKRCAHLTQADKTYLAVAFTECHLELYTHHYTKRYQAVPCQEVKDDREMAECIKDLNTGEIFPIFISFKTSLESLCQEVDREFARRRANEAMDAIMSATLHTARSLGQLQEGTDALSRDMQSRLAHSSSAVMELLSSHSNAEAERFEAISEATAKLERGQDTMMDSLTHQTTHLRNLLSDAQGIQRLINATSRDIAATQSDIIALQEQASSTLASTREDMITLKQAQEAHFQSALQSLQTLHALSITISNEQASASAAVASLAAEQTASFSKASEQLTNLREEQQAAFDAATNRMTSIRDIADELSVQQGALLSNVRTSEEEIRRMSATQRKEFERTGESLHRIHEHATEVETKLSTMLLDLKAAATQLLNLNLDLLSEMFQIHSALFYVALAPLAYFSTATDRTKSARFWIFTAILTALLLELNLASTAQRFHWTYTQSEFDTLRARLRYCLACMSMLMLALSACLHRDYISESHELHVRNSKVVDNNHRMLHELLRRTEHMINSTTVNSPPIHTTHTVPSTPLRSSKVATHSPSLDVTIKYGAVSPTQSNPFQQGSVNPEGEGTKEELPELERFWQSTTVHGPDACCEDQRTQKGMMARFIERASNNLVRKRDEPTDSSHTMNTHTRHHEDDNYSPPSPVSSRHVRISEPLTQRTADPSPAPRREGAPKANTSSSSSSSNTLRRSSRSRSRAPEVPPPTTSSRKSGGGVKIEEEEEEQPGLEAKTRRQSRGRT